MNYESHSWEHLVNFLAPNTDQSRKVAEFGTDSLLKRPQLLREGAARRNRVRSASFCSKSAEFLRQTLSARRNRAIPQVLITKSGCLFSEIVRFLVCSRSPEGRHALWRVGAFGRRSWFSAPTRKRRANRPNRLECVVMGWWKLVSTILMARLPSISGCYSSNKSSQRQSFMRCEEVGLSIYASNIEPSTAYECMRSCSQDRQIFVEEGSGSRAYKAIRCDCALSALLAHSVLSFHALPVQFWRQFFSPICLLMT